ncbi:MAG: VCBS repeat-containing protein [Acidobacteriota bacterium]
MKIAALIAIFALACDTADFNRVETLGAYSIKQPHFTEISASPISVGPYAGEPAVADCNNDGNADIILACGTCCGSPAKPESGHVMVLLGDGRGNFNRAKDSPIKIASSARKIALGDVNRDNRIDIFVAQHDSYDVVVLIGDGRGGFKPLPPIAASRGTRPHTHDITAGDVNGDGNTDFLTTNANDHSISVMLGDGSGNFAPAPSSPIVVARHPYDVVALSDINGDGRLDIITPDLMNNKVVALLGDGRGGFARAPSSPFAMGSRPGYVSVADINRDGKPDFVATHDDDPLAIVMLGDGAGGFQAAAGSPLKPEGAVWGTAIGDVNGDGLADIAMASGANASVVIMLGDGRGGFTQSAKPLRAGTWVNYVAMADFNKDGKLDLVASNYGSGDINVWLNATK